MTDLIEIPKLWYHQEDVRSKLRRSLIDNRSSILCLSPGGGKTRIAKSILGMYANREKRPDESGFACFTVHKRSLVDNASFSFAQSPELPHGILMSGSRTKVTLPIQVGSIDTMLSWLTEGEVYTSDTTFDLLVHDETDNHFGKFRRFVTMHAEKRRELGLSQPFLLGLTGTPQAKGLGEVYNDIVFGPETEWLIAQGYHKSYRYFSCKQGRLDRLVASDSNSNGYTDKSQALAFDGLHGDMVRDWIRHGKGRATVGFFPLCSHAREACQEFLNQGIIAAYVDGKTPDSERRQLFSDLNNHKIEYLCNVGVVDRGTDIENTSCIQVCCAVRQKKKWIQMITRGSRKSSERMDCIVLDHGGNLTNERGMPFVDDPVEWSLSGDKPLSEAGERAKILCPECDAVYRGGKCSNCGYEPTKRERMAQGLDFDGSELIEVNRRRKTDDKPKEQSNEEILRSAMYRGGRSRMTVRQVYGMARKAAEKAGNQWSLPSHIFTTKSMGTKHKVIGWDHPDANRRVADVYGFTAGDYSPEVNQHQEFTDAQ